MKVHNYDVIGRFFIRVCLQDESITRPTQRTVHLPTRRVVFPTYSTCNFYENQIPCQYNNLPGSERIKPPHLERSKLAVKRK